MNGNRLLAIWLNRVLLEHFKKQKTENTDKLFLKISGLTDTDVNAFLLKLKEEKSVFENYYSPIIRTIEKVEGFEEFSYQEYETSTWLRNNTKQNQALVLIINKITPEAQSLENIFTIDEAYLLSDSGLKSLYNVLSENGYVAPDEVKHVQEFIEMYTHISEPQLRSIINFLVELLNDQNPSVIDKIQRKLPYLSLFVDSKLKIDIQDLPRLRRNYQLANLYIKESEQENIQNNLYSFLEEEEKNNYQNEIWETKTVEELSNDVIEFITQSSDSLLFYDFDFINMVVGFKVKAPTLIEQIKDVYENQKQDFDEEQQKEFDKGIDEVANGEDPDAIQEFIDNFEEELNTKSGLVKRLERVVDKLRNPSEYDDISQAIMREIYNFIEENKDNTEIISSKFSLEILTQKASENVVELLKFYLKNIQNVIQRLNFTDDTLPSIDDSTKESEVVFELKHLINDKLVGTKKFKVTGLHQLEAFTFLEKVKEDEIPYIKNYAENEIEQINLLTFIRKKVRHYLISNESEIQEHLNEIEEYLKFYITILKGAATEGVFSIDIKSLENELTDLLKNIYSSSLVSQHIYQNINLIGAIDYFDNNKGETGIPTSRKLTVINPVRLIAYIQRWEELANKIDEWISFASRGLLNVEKPEEYLEYVHDRTSYLAPRYFSSYGDPSFLIENYESFGEGTFVLNTKHASNLDYLANELSSELLKTAKSYFEVYPFAKDGLDICMLYCQSSEVIKKCVESLFLKTELKKLRLLVHSENAALLYHQLNKWLEQKEEFTKAAMNSKFPKLELNIISGRSPNDIFSQINKYMNDADLVVLADYFGQGNQISYRLERVKPMHSNSWFETIYKEPLKNDEAVKRISFVSEHLPNLLQYFYQMQYIVQTNAMPSRDELNVLKNVISISNINQSSLIDMMHKKFNWTMILDRYLDKTLLTKTSVEANIIQYKPKAGKTNKFKLIVSSSKYIRKLSDATSDYAYYDRLHRKLVSILKNENISKEVVVDAVNSVKDISGALVLKVIGRGKYAHEMLAAYLSTKNRLEPTANKLQIWSVCDELPWFANNKRRPDLVITTLENIEGKINIHFELVELKFVNHNIFDKERFDALKQIKVGLNLYKGLFTFNKEQLDSDYWRNELIRYLVERNSYSPEHAILIKEFQHANLDEISVTISGSVDVYCYTSNLTDYSFKNLGEGKYVDQLDSNIKNYIFSRTFILNELDANEEQQPSYEELINFDDEQEAIMNSLGYCSGEMEEEKFGKDRDTTMEDKVASFEEKVADEVSYQNQIDIEEYKKSADKDFWPNGGKKGENDKLTSPDNENEKRLYLIEDKKDRESKGINDIANTYPEVRALAGMEILYDDSENDSEQLKEQYIRKLKNNFNQNGIHIKVKDSIIGSSVIRLDIELPADLPVNKVLTRSKDIQYWLDLSSEPHIFIKKGLKIDIIREEPETIYFENFMALVRKQLSNVLTETNLVAPLGLDPLNNVIYMDFSNSMSPHLLTGGTTGSGKSVTLNSIILGIMCLYNPEQVQFLFIDPKKVEFTIYEGKKHTSKVITELHEAVDVLHFYVNEMEERYTKFAQEGVTNLDEYITELGENLPRVVIVFDEFADFMTQDPDMKKQVENLIMRLGQKARAAGIHLIICTQNPKADIINTNIRNNLGARLALRASDANASSVILDEAGAEKLAGKGDFLAKLYGNIERGKSPYLTPKVRRALLKYFNKE